MDYEKKYKELVGQIKKAHLYAQTDSTKAVLEDILPELKENEDEKIRKYILSCCEETIKANDRGLELSMETTIKLRDWLEKQGDQKPKISSNYFLDEYVRFKECAIKEKHSKENPYSGVSFEYNGHTWGMCARDNGVEILVDGEIKERVYLFDRPQGKSALETLKEEKVDNQNCANPVVKVESKFHRGDWVVDKEGNISKIMRVVNDFNHITYACRFKQKSVFWSSYSENKIRLWDITKDAKDGDVLVDGNLPFIFKKIDTNKHIYAYCGISVDDGFKIESDGESGEWTWMQDIKPATEEQRDVLFSKMKEAGYEWDADRKELKKIEQSKLTAFEEAVKDMMDDYRDAIDDNKATTEEVKERAAYMLSLIPQKPAEWREDDEGICRAIINDIANDKSMCTFDISKGICDKKINWLKSLKDRVTTQPKQEWSEEDEEEANYIADFIENLLKKEKLVSKKTMTMENMIAWLRDIKYCYLPKPEQGWSEEDDAMIKETLYFLREYQQSNRCKDENGMQNSVTCENWLKSLKNRITWKPSDEQMKMLENVRKILHTNKDIYSKANNLMYNFEELIRTLKKLREE